MAIANYKFIYELEKRRALSGESQMNAGAPPVAALGIIGQVVPRR